MKEQDQKALLWIAIVAILFMELLVFGGLGIAVPISVIIYYILVLLQSNQLKIKNSRKSNILLIPIFMTALCFVFFDNSLLKLLNIIFLYVLIILHISQQFKINRFEFLSFKWLMEAFPIGILMPFENIMSSVEVVKKQIKGRTISKDNIFLKVLIGIVIGLPIVIIATILLMNTDVAFESVIGFIGENCKFDLLDILERIIVFTIIFSPLYGLFYGIRNSKKNIDENEVKNNIKIKFDFVIVITVTSLLCIVYIIYCLSQLTYFISAFQGILPSHYTFAQYARKGFFECIPLVIMNLIIIIFLSLFINYDGSKKKRNLVKGYVSYIVAFTLFLVTSAFSKMWLYIEAYGITIMRAYVTWFLILMCIVLLLILVKTYYSKFKLSKVLFISFAVMFLSLNYFNIDYRIAEYDANLYLTGQVDTISAFDELSNSALEPLMQISKKDNHKTSSILKKYKNRVYGNEAWQEWNIVNFKAKDIFENR